jgi:hypothetical protein
VHRHFTLGVATGQPGLTRCRTAGFTTFTTDSGHVGASLTHGHATLPAGVPRFVGRPFVRRPLLVGRTPTLAGNFFLSSWIH